MKLRLSPREKGVGQDEALRKTEQRGDMSKGVCVWRVEVGGGEEKREKTKDTKTGFDFSSDYSWWKLYKKF